MRILKGQQQLKSDFCFGAEKGNCSFRAMDRIIGTLLICGVALMAFSTFSSIYVAYKVYPEIGMVVKSQCKNPTPSWNGKVMGVQVCLHFPLISSWPSIIIP
jgi:hypothetical protein